jgi:type II secretory pathway pseudopilin PulG
MNIKIHQYIQRQRGVTLIETVVALSIVMLVVVGGVVLARSVVVSSAQNKNQLIAVNLAREALEVARIQRDHNWMDGVFYKEGMIGSVEGNTVGVRIGCFTMRGVLSVRENVGGDVIGGPGFEEMIDVDCDGNIFDTSIMGSGEAGENIPVYIAVDEEALNPEHAFLDYYGNDIPEGSDLFEPRGATPFFRWVKIESIPGVDKAGGCDVIGATLCNPSKLFVTAVVGWKQAGREHKIELSQELYDWKNEYADQDEDGFGAWHPQGYDCDDLDPLVNPGVIESATADPRNDNDGIDNDCDGIVDEEF